MEGCVDHCQVQTSFWRKAGMGRGDLGEFPGGRGRGGPRLHSLKYSSRGGARSFPFSQSEAGAGPGVSSGSATPPVHPSISHLLRGNGLLTTMEGNSGAGAARAARRWARGRGECDQPHSGGDGWGWGRGGVGEGLQQPQVQGCWTALRACPCWRAKSSKESPATCFFHLVSPEGHPYQDIHLGL